jgi:hypothetical protein
VTGKQVDNTAASLRLSGTGSTVISKRASNDEENFTTAFTTIAIDKAKA